MRDNGDKMNHFNRSKWLPLSPAQINVTTQSKTQGRQKEANTKSISTFMWKDEIAVGVSRHRVKMSLLMKYITGIPISEATVVGVNLKSSLPT